MLPVKKCMWYIPLITMNGLQIEKSIKQLHSEWKESIGDMWHSKTVLNLCDFSSCEIHSKLFKTANSLWNMSWQSHTRVIQWWALSQSHHKNMCSTILNTFAHYLSLIIQICVTLSQSHYTNICNPISVSLYKQV